MRTVFAVVMAAAFLSGCAQTAPQNNVVHASASDCAVIAEVGKATLLWGKQKQTALFYTEYDLPGGGLYTEDCDWRRYGVDPLLEKKDYIGQAYISRPEYLGDTATTDFSFAIVPGNGKAPFMSGSHCTLQKAGDRWHLVGCAHGPIT